MKSYKFKIFFTLLLATAGVFFYNFSQSKVVVNCPNKAMKTSTEYSVNIQKLKSLHIKLDSLLVVNESTMIQYIPNTNELVINDKNNRRLLKYQLTQEIFKEPKIIKFSKNRKGFQGFHYLSKDSILLYDYSDHSLYLANSIGVGMKKFTFEDTNLRRTFSFNPSLPYVSNMSPLIVKGDSIIATGFMDGEHGKDVFTGRTVRTRLNIKTGEIKYDLTYPKIYEKGNWGGEMFRSVYSFYNYEENLHVLSFPADHNLTVVNKQNVLSYFPAYSNKYTVCNQPLGMKKSELVKQKKHFALNHFFDNVSYRGIVYDKFNEFYYRFTEIPEGKKADLFKYKKTVVLIFDKGFNYVSEFEIPKYLLTENSFITPEGIFFLNTNNKNENIAEYEQYKIIKINNNTTITNK